MRWSVPIILPAALALGACNSGEGEGTEGLTGPDAEGCEHLTDGPFVPVTAPATSAGVVPAVAADHQAYRVSFDGADTGVVQFAAPAATHYVFYLSEPIEGRFFTPGGTDVRASAGQVALCPAIRKKLSVSLAVGTTYLELTSARRVVDVVVEPLHGE